MSGLEAFAVAASIIQVADLGTKLSVKLFSFYRQVKSANESIQLLSNEIALVSAILRELGDSLREEGSSKLCSDEALQTLSRVLNQCRDVLGQIQRVIDTNDQTGKSRFQQVTGKFRLVLVEPSLDQLKMSLERLKSTMLLLLNVIMYAGHLRSSNVPTLLQEQRSLIENLLEDRHNDNQKPCLPDRAMSSQAFSTQTASSKTASIGTDEISKQKSDPNLYQPTLKEQPSDWPGNNNKARIRSDEAMDNIDSAELEEYNILIESMLRKVDSCKAKLEDSRYLRIKNGVLNIHSGEIVRFQLEHGPSIHIDPLLFAEQNTKKHVSKPTDTPAAYSSGTMSEEDRFQQNVDHMGGWIQPYEGDLSFSDYPEGDEMPKLGDKPKSSGFQPRGSKLPAQVSDLPSGRSLHTSDDTLHVAYYDARRATPESWISKYLDDDDAQKQTSSESLLLLLPGNLEDLLAMWTTLDKNEIQRGKVLTF
ncbi:hypothetical protein N7472_005118 [Penicillium cf. griseofulvum]|uniref:Fungal N-terminal domain-containing protein n=1 Tax=Penicillium cf. griseofulvum TaxID=2972120 RepID=A0A9W9MFE0_9EURO|nr:hypothetical protein N7472_005118 [Penicillium cf. griseofulvum]